MSKALLFFIVLTVLSASCISTQAQDRTPDEIINSEDLTGAMTFGYTHLRPDGNRYMEGKSELPNVRPIDRSLNGRPLWIAAAPTAEGSIWVVVLEDGRTQAFEWRDGIMAEITIEPKHIPPGMPPLLIVKDGKPKLVEAHPSDATTLTHPIILNNSGLMAFIEENGDLVLWDGEEEKARFGVKALPDARIMVDENERLLLLTGATTRYGHGVLGDGVEAASITLIETSPEPRIALEIDIKNPTVVEGLAPIWTDITGDGAREIIVTVSDPEDGATVRVYDENGEVVASGPPAGTGFRWRHQLAVAPFGPDGEMEIAEVLTPHLGKTVQFYQMEGDTLEVVANIQGYTTHISGSRNLDMTVAGDFNGDGQVEIIVLDPDFTKLAGVQRTKEGAAVMWTVHTGGDISTNLAAVTHPNGDLVLGVGVEGDPSRDGALRFWHP